MDAGDDPRILRAALRAALKQMQHLRWEVQMEIDGMACLPGEDPHPSVFSKGRRVRASQQVEARITNLLVRKAKGGT